MKHYKVAKHLLEVILSNNAEPTAEGLSELFEVKHGNKEVILEHFRALKNIFERAIKELEGE